MPNELGDPHKRCFPNAPATQTRRGHLEAQFLARVRAMAGSHMTGADGVEHAAYELVDELRKEGLLCEQVLLAFKALVTGSAPHPYVLTGEIVPLCITHYYRTQP